MGEPLAVGAAPPDESAPLPLARSGPEAAASRLVHWRYDCRGRAVALARQRDVWLASLSGCHAACSWRSTVGSGRAGRFGRVP